MTISQKLLGTKITPLTRHLSSVIFTSVLIGMCSSSYADNSNNSANVIANSPATTSNLASTTTITPAAMGSTSITATTKPIAGSGTTINVTSPQIKAVTASAPLDQANMSDNDLLGWATDAAQLAYTYDFKNYPKQMQLLKDYFTPEGWRAFTTALDKSNNLNVVQNRKLVASASPIGKATLLKEGVKNGLYTWKVQLPMQATYESESRLIKQNLLVTLLISRTSNSKGVGISHFVALITPATTTPISQTNAPTNDATLPGTNLPAPGTPTTPGSSPATTTPPASIYNQPATTGTVPPPSNTTVAPGPAPMTGGAMPPTTVTPANPPTMSTTPNSNTTPPPPMDGSDY